MDINNAQLRQFLNSYFDSDELDDLCFDYFPRVQQQFTRGMTKNDQIRLLLTHCRDHGEHARLIGALQKLRPTSFCQEFELAQPEPTPTYAPATPIHRNPGRTFINHTYEDAKLALSADWYGDYSNASQNNPTGPNVADFKVLRGGSWYFNPHDVRSATRNKNTLTDCYYNVGFRCALAPGS